jgi:uroporphyrinogen III methyltransferase/synthase
MSAPRVAVTTAADRLSVLSAMVRKRGLDPVELPCVEVVAFGGDNPQRLRDQAESADLIVVTSARAVTFTWPEGGMPPVPVAAVGPATAEAVSRAGGHPQVVGSGGAADLVAELESGISGKVVIFPHADGADPATAKRLRDAGARVVALPVYETRPTAPGPDPVDAAIFGSPSAVEGWCRSRSLDDLVVAAIGETTARAVRVRGAEPQVVPARPDFDLLSADLSRYLKERSPV